MNSQERNILQDEAGARSYVEGWADKAAMERLDLFAKLLLKENQRQNLISKPSESQLWLRHFADSAQLLEHVPRETLSAPKSDPWLDLGTGAGFPGIVIAAIHPNTPVVLVESRQRRVEFLANAAQEMALPKCMVIGERLERIEPFHARVISARAFAPLEKLLRLSAPFSTKRTRYVLPKGRSAAQELAEQKKSIRSMFHVEHSLTDSEAGIIVTK
ncbi:MAG: 16S rRNA (guanine(527)-N(7))-methyltransferase RsmG [Pseudomonadota bacterium]|nr:16S rRNA (guanine(527)-N(7))-methyltransferase RsmG [Pseudomonadota bacterium]